MAVTQKQKRPRKFCAIGNHILSFSTFWEISLIIIFFFLIPVEKFEFSVVRSKLKIFAIFRSDYG